MKKFYSYEQASNVLCEVLDIDRNNLAGLMGITEKSLLYWESKSVTDRMTDSKRLEFLYEVVRYINYKFPELKSLNYLRVLENSVVILDHEDEEGFVTLINLITHDPYLKYWQPIVDKSINDYLSETNFIKT